MKVVKEKGRKRVRFILIKRDIKTTENRACMLLCNNLERKKNFPLGLEI